MSLDAEGVLKMVHSQDRSFHLGNKRYAFRSTSEDAPFDAQPGPCLVTVFRTDQSSSKITEQAIKQQIEHYQDHDDVFQIAFLQGAIFLGQVQLDGNAQGFLAGLGMKWCQLLSSTEGEQLEPGPYILSEGYLRRVYRMHKDTAGALFCALEKEGNNDGYTTFDLVECIGEPSLMVKVSSRLYSTRSHTRPLAGLRVVVKDNLDVKGVKTSLTSRPFYETYPVKQQTADSIQRLVDLGATLVAKTKMTSYATWEEPNESIDYPAPWNPRADGFLSAGGSSNGSAAAVSTYDWLDIAIGSDTTGSIMRPALWNGCFALRPSHGVLSLHGFFGCIEYLDTPAFLGRNLQLCRDFASAWYGSHPIIESNPKQVTSILWPQDYWVMIDDAQCKLTRDFVSDLEIFLNVKTTEVSFKAKWQSEPPAEAAGQGLDEYMIEATENMWYDDYHAFDEFRAIYYSKHQKPPYVSPPTYKAWQACKPITESQRDAAVKKLDIFRAWFRKRVTKADTENPVMILPIENVYPRYRDETHSFQRPPIGVHTLLLASLTKSPELVVPIGTIPYISKISERKEQLPFAVGLMGLPGTDLHLLDITHACLEKNGRPTEVKTGVTMFQAARPRESL